MPEDRVFVDSPVWVPPLRRGAPAPLAEQVAGLARQGRAVLAGPVRLELLRGAKTEPALKMLRARTAILADLAMPETIWDEAGNLGFNLARKGVTVAGMDLLLATLVLHHGCSLLHLDSDFDRISRVAPLRMVEAAWRPT